MSYATAAQTTFDQVLGTLDYLLGKAAASDRGEALLSARLVEDMHPLSAQVRMTTYQVLNTLNRLAGGQYAHDGVDDTSIAAARERIATVRAIVQGTGSDTWLAAGAPIEFDVPNGTTFALAAHEYARDWALPQVYFHLMAVYAILRKEGLAIGKADYLPYMMRHLKAPPTV